jgi:eukaryotic-like serine/threonine-protein kinase
MLDREFGPYRLSRRLGRGGMADVYLARNLGTGSDVALKVVEQKADRDSEEICEAERRGAILQQQFSEVDGHVPRVHATGSLDGYFFIEMEYVDGEDLAERIARGPLPADEAAGLASELCEFLDKAHAFEATVDGTRLRGIIHADIKPKNVRLSAAGQLKVLDFGIAKGLALSRKLTRNDFGSLAYLSPERLDSGEVDVHVDFWSVGVLLYEMLAAAPPFEADTNSRLEALIRRREPPGPLPESCPPALTRIVLKMLAGDLRRRYQSAAEMRSDLEAFRSKGETQADREWADAMVEETRRTAAPEADPAEAEATRRTVNALTESEATRRTTDKGPGSLPADAEAAVPANGPIFGQDPQAGGAATEKKGPGPLSRPMGKLQRWLAAAALIAGIAAVGNETIVWSDAKELRVKLATGESSEVQGVWDRYQGLSQRSLLGIGLLGVKSPLKERLRTQADRVISDFRQDEPTVREAQWREAATWLTDLLNIDPGDRAATARLRYCEGQLQRITGDARKRKKQPATQAWLDAVTRFEEAGKLDTRWPDPYLAMVRTYVYSLEDVDKATDALNEAERRGYRTGSRELVQLADGYRGRGDRMRREASSVKGLEQERPCLEKAAADYTKAIEIYGKSIGFGDASSSMKLTQARLEDVKKRLSELSEAQ